MFKLKEKVQIIYWTSIYGTIPLYLSETYKIWKQTFCMFQMGMFRFFSKIPVMCKNIVRS
jgi:hypothetical protein